MGLLNLFSREKKERLDQGLEKTKTGGNNEGGPGDLRTGGRPDRKRDRKTVHREPDPDKKAGEKIHEVPLNL